MGMEGRRMGQKERYGTRKKQKAVSGSDGVTAQVVAWTDHWAWRLWRLLNCWDPPQQVAFWGNLHGRTQWAKGGGKKNWGFWI